MKIEINDNYCTVETESETELLAGLTILVKAIKMTGISKERINHAVEIAFMNKKEVREDTKKHLENILRKLGLEG